MKTWLRKLHNYVMHGIWTDCEHTVVQYHGFYGQWRCVCGAQG